MVTPQYERNILKRDDIKNRQKNQKHNQLFVVLLARIQQKAGKAALPCNVICTGWRPHSDPDAVPRVHVHDRHPSPVWTVSGIAGVMHSFYYTLHHQFSVEIVLGITLNYMYMEDVNSRETRSEVSAWRTIAVAVIRYNVSEYKRLMDAQVGSWSYCVGVEGYL